MNDFKIAFLSKYQFDSDAIRGAVLVTDKETKPLEFRVTEAVRPTKVQRTLYGEILYDYILVELIAVPLLAALTEKPKFVLVDDDMFMDVNNKQEIPVIRLEAQESVNYEKNKFIIQDIKSSKFPSLRIIVSKNLEAKLIDIQQCLEEIYMIRDLLEPFKRIQQTCTQINN
ncbi:hypothetical protein [Anabaena sp. CCY 0017]|uniref:hypothetical protein n=1 Tax=Anabaena sp. CCY 0017 TaxID=3103866 RepID=UPI0039C6E6A4